MLNKDQQQQVIRVNGLLQKVDGAGAVRPLEVLALCQVRDVVRGLDGGLPLLRRRRMDVDGLDLRAVVVVRQHLPRGQDVERLRVDDHVAAVLAADADDLLPVAHEHRRRAADVDVDVGLAVARVRGDLHGADEVAAGGVEDDDRVRVAGRGERGRGSGAFGQERAADLANVQERLIDSPLDETPRRGTKPHIPR